MSEFGSAVGGKLAIIKSMNMNNFFEEFKVQLKKAIIEDYKSLLKLSDGEKAYACALVTDSDAMTLFFAMNTIEKYSQINRSRK